MMLLAAITSTAFNTSLLTCDQANELIDKINSSVEYRSEIIRVIKDSSGQCNWDAND